MKNPSVGAPGALVISLDFELHWGLPDLPLSDTRVRDRLLRTREVIPEILALFEEFGIAATWATVGRLFGTSAREIEDVRPRSEPGYLDRRLFAGGLAVGSCENDDPFHYAPTLIERIRQTPRQEIGTHTFSHFYCLEAGQSKAEFAEDLTAACELARRRGIALRSIVFPRNQENPMYRSVLIENGIIAYRGNPSGVWRATNTAKNRAPARRAVRLIDSFVQWTSRDGYAWSDILTSDGLANVRATAFLRPYDSRLVPVEELRFRRIAATLERAARLRRIIHLWWHPHNFGTQPAQNIVFLRRILSVFERCRAAHGMTSLSMAEVAAIAQGLEKKARQPTRSMLV